MSAALAEAIESKQEERAIRMGDALAALRGSVFARVGAMETRAIAARLLGAIADDARAGSPRRLRDVTSSTLGDLGPKGLAFHDIRALVSALRREVLQGMDEATGVGADEVGRVRDWLFELCFQSGFLYVSQREETIEEQGTLLEIRLAELRAAHTKLGSVAAETIRRLSTPIAPIHEGILVVPLVGMLDEPRAQGLRARLLDEVSRAGARFVILDVSGADQLDDATAGHLVSTGNAIALLGAELVIAGLSPENAIQLASAGTDLGRFATKRTIGAGLEHALAAMGLRIGSSDAAARS